MLDRLAAIADVLDPGVCVVASVFVLAAGRRNGTWLRVAAPLLLVMLAAQVVFLVLGFAAFARGADADPELAQRLAQPWYVLDWIYWNLRVLVLTLAGLHACELARRRGLPLLQRLMVREPPAEGPSSGRWLAETCAITIAWLASTLLLFPPDAVRHAAGAIDTWSTSDLFQLLWTFLLLQSVFQSIAEELAYRLGIVSVVQRACGARRFALPAGLGTCALLWTLAHLRGDGLDTLRLVQLLPVGLALGLLQRRHGTEACITAHVVHNVGLLLIAPWFVSLSG